MADCLVCGAPTDPLDRFCGRCGKALSGVAPVDKPLDRFCRACGKSVEADARFCRRCGSPVPEPAEDVFAGMALGNGWSVAVAESPPVPITNGGTTEARTESIPRPEVAQPPPPAARPRPRPARRPRPASAPAPSTETVTIDRIAVRPPEEPPQPTRPATEPVARAIPETELTASGGFPWGGTLALLGALGVIFSAVLEWGGPFGASLPRDISAAWLLDPASAPMGPSLGVILLLAGTLGALVSLVGMAAPAFSFLRRAVGLLTATIPVAFAFRTLQSAESSIADLPSALGVGVVVAGAGGFAQLVARRPRRHA